MEDYTSDLKRERYLGGHNSNISEENILGTTSGMPPAWGILGVSLIWVPGKRWIVSAFCMEWEEQLESAWGQTPLNDSASPRSEIAP